MSALLRNLLFLLHVYGCVASEQCCIFVQDRRDLLAQERLGLVYGHAGEGMGVNKFVELRAREPEDRVSQDALEQVVAAAMELDLFAGGDAVLPDASCRACRSPPFSLTQYMRMFSVARNGSSSARCFSAIFGYTVRPRMTLRYSVRMPSVARNASGMLMRRLAESSSVRSNHWALAVTAAFCRSQMT